MSDVEDGSESVVDNPPRRVKFAFVGRIAGEVWVETTDSDDMALEAIETKLGMSLAGQQIYLQDFDGSAVATE